MDTLKKFTKYEKEILEGIIISIVGGWALTSILRGAYKQISNIQFPADGNFTKAFIMTIQKQKDCRRINVCFYIYIPIVMCFYWIFK